MNVTNSFAQNLKDISYDKVFIYEFEHPVDQIQKEKPDIIGKELDTSLFTKYAFLTNQESKQLFDKLNDKKTFSNSSAICWMPHLGIYFLKNNRVVNLVEVCMDCNRLQSTLKHKIAEPETVRGVAYPKGMSASFRKFINELLIQYNFDHTLKDYEGIWDKSKS